jgi:hypothetical protein
LLFRSLLYPASQLLMNNIRVQLVGEKLNGPLIANGTITAAMFLFVGLFWNAVSSRTSVNFVRVFPVILWYAKYRSLLLVTSWDFLDGITAF